MNRTATRRDVNAAVGMMLAYKEFARTRSKITALEALSMVLQKDVSEIWFVQQLASNHAESLLRALEGMSADELDISPDIDRDNAIKETMVMAALAEGSLVLVGKSFEDVDISGEPSDEKMRELVADHDPHMINMIANMIVTGSYPKANPTEEVLAALWIEGFLVSVMQELAFEDLSKTPAGEALLKAAEGHFDIID